MKLEKARQILELSVTTGFYGDAHEFTDAKKLGIEALKRVKHGRGNYQRISHALLPGETEE